MNKHFCKVAATIACISFLLGLITLLSGCCVCCTAFKAGYYSGRAEVFLSDEKFDEALECINKSIDLAPDDPEYKKLKEDILKAKEDSEKNK